MLNVARRNVHRFETDCLDNLDKKLHPTLKVEQPKPRISKSQTFFRMAVDAAKEWMAGAVAPMPQLVPVRSQPARVEFSGTPATASSPSRFGPRRKHR